VKLVHLFFVLALCASAQSTPDARYDVAFRDGMRALNQDALLSARASFTECLAIRPADPPARVQIDRIDARIRSIERANAFKTYWKIPASVYVMLLLASLFFGLRAEQRAHNMNNPL
jgi:hypothetical protein